VLVVLYIAGLALLLAVFGELVLLETEDITAALIWRLGHLLWRFFVEVILRGLFFDWYELSSVWVIHGVVIVGIGFLRHACVSQINKKL